MGWSGAYGDDVVFEVMDRLTYDHSTGDIRWSDSKSNGGKSKCGEIAGSLHGRCAIGLRSAKLPRIYAAYILMNGSASDKQLYPNDGDYANTKPDNVMPVPAGHSFKSWMNHIGNGMVNEVGGVTVISRSDAIAAGMNRYFTGVACKKGHVAMRTVVGRVCVECNKEFSARPDQLRRRAENERKRVASLSDEVRDEMRKRAKDWYENNKDARSEYMRVNADRYRRLNARSMARRKAEDPIFVMLCHCRVSLCRMLARFNIKRKGRTHEMLGYGPSDLYASIESKFKDGMGWHNRSEWHIDHICPVSKLIAAGATDMSIINHLDNLQPMWAKENIIKSDRIVDQDLFDRLVRMARQR